MDWKKALRVAMAMRGMRVKDLREKSGVRDTSRIYNRGSMTTDSLEKMAGALEMKVSELVKLGEE